MTAAVWIGAHLVLMSVEKYNRIAENPSVRLFDTFKFNPKAEIAETFGRA